MRSIRTIAIALTFVCASACAQAQASPHGWSPTVLPFRALAITGRGGSFWTCGTNEGIASSTDGRSWTTYHHQTNGALLLGVAFPTDSFGYAYGTGGTFLTTTDAGATWNVQAMGSETILRASFSDPEHGVFRTASSVYIVNGGTPRQLSMPKSVPPEFKYVSDVASLSPQRMAIAVSQGWRSETAFLSTIDGGASWMFYDPPHIVPYQLLVVNGRYWTVGTETVGYDQPGGGLGVPLVMSSGDGNLWQHTKANTNACDWEGCHLCTTSGCLASAELIADPFSDAVKTATIPPGHISPYWASAGGSICVIDHDVYCSRLERTIEVDKSGPSVPSDPTLPPLGTKEQTGMLRCLRCSLDPIFTDPKVGGQFSVHIALTIHADGTVQDASVDSAPSNGVREKILEAMKQWLFEPPTRDGKPISVATKQTITVMVVHSR